MHVRKILRLPNRRLFDCFESRIALATEFRRYRPKIVIGFGNKTPMASPDHHQAMMITDAAVFYSRLSKWDEHFEGLAVHTIRATLFSTLFRIDGDGEFGSHITVDITDQLEKKVESVLCYKTQFPPGKATRLGQGSSPCDCKWIRRWFRCWRGLFHDQTFRLQGSRPNSPANLSKPWHFLPCCVPNCMRTRRLKQRPGSCIFDG